MFMSFAFEFSGGNPPYEPLDERSYDRTEERQAMQRATLSDTLPDGDLVSVVPPETPTFGGEIDDFADSLLRQIPVEDMAFHGKFLGTRRDYLTYAIRQAIDGPGHTFRNPSVYRSFCDTYQCGLTRFEYLLSDILPSYVPRESATLENTNRLNVQHTPAGDVMLGYGYLGTNDKSGRPTRQTFVTKLSRQQYDQVLATGRLLPLVVEATIRRSPLGQAILPGRGMVNDIKYGIGDYREANRHLVVVDVPPGLGMHYGGNRAGEILSEVIDRRIQATATGKRAHLVDYVPPRPPRTTYIDPYASEQVPSLSAFAPVAMIQSAIHKRQQQAQRKASHQARRQHEWREDQAIADWRALDPAVHELDRYDTRDHADRGFRIDTQLFHLQNR
jgi:hypothetical protein